MRAFVPVREFTEDHFLVMGTKNGVIKKTFLTEFSRPRKTGIIALDWMRATISSVPQLPTETATLMAKSGGKAIRFHEKTVRAMGRGARGVRGVEIEDQESVVGMVCVKGETSQHSRGHCERLRQAHEAGGLPHHRTWREGHHHGEDNDRNGDLIAIKEDRPRRQADDRDQRRWLLIRMSIEDTWTMGATRKACAS